MTSFWIDAPRQNFSQHCIDHFGVTFDGTVLETNQHVTRAPSSLPKKVSFEDIQPAQRKRNGHKGAQTMVSQRALQGRRLVG